MQLKKAQINLVVTLILILLILVVVIISVTGQWKTIGQKINILGSYEQNIEVIQNKCELACIQKDVKTYCKDIQKLKINEEKQIKETCEKLSFQSFEGFEIKSCPKLCD